MKAKKWLALVLGTTWICLCAVALLNFIIDPCFHYRKPADKIYYLLHDERYQNDGIQKHFTYDAMITGTSMTQNFKASELDEIFEVSSIKTPYSGGSYKEINDAVDTAIRSNEALKIVVRGLDLSLVVSDAEYMRYTDYPIYLYDYDIWNDVKYLLNLNITFSMTAPSVLYSIKKQESTTFDEYSNWNYAYTFGKESVLKKYDHPEAVDAIIYLSDKDREIERGNVIKNVSSTIAANPQIDFYYFLTPYSIVYWDEANQKGELEREIEIQRVLIEELLPYNNCHLFSWCDDAELVCNLDNYKDTIHYGEWVNSDMLRWMHDGNGRLTEDNYEQYLSNIRELYGSYDYDALFK